MPVFYDKMAQNLSFTMSREKNKDVSFEQWREKAYQKAIDCLQNPPPKGDFAIETLDMQDRGSYTVERVVIRLTEYSNICSYLLKPKGDGPFPAMLLNHDHGARFSIGKEKVVRPFNVMDSKAKEADEWVTECYGGRFIGDELCKRGYVCLAIDAINWGDRYGAWFDCQQSFGSVMMLLGASFAGFIAWEDMYAAEFLSSLPYVDEKRIGTIGLSMGGYRTFQAAALSPHIMAGVSVCWMASIPTLIVPGNNMTGGQSAFSMLHPGMTRYMDYPDLASLACPKPMMFISGTHDTLFPLDSVRHAYLKMEAVWAEQGAGDVFCAKMWDSPHQFSLAMQEEAFAWLDMRFNKV